MTTSLLTPGTLAKAAEIGKRIGPETRPRDFGEIFQGRWGTIIARDPTTRTVTVEMGKETDVPMPGILIGNPTYYPHVGDEVMLALQGRGGIILGAKNAKVAAVRIQKTGAAAISSGVVTIVNFSEAGVKGDPSNLYDEGVSASRVSFSWPGSYGFGGGCYWADDSTATGRRNCDILMNGAAQIATDRRRAQTTDNTCNPSGEYFFDAGDYIEMQVFQSSGGPLNVNLVSEMSPVIWASWRGPT